MNLKIGFLVAGIKGLNFLKAFSAPEEIEFVASYPFKQLQFQPVDEIKTHCQSNNFTYFDVKDLKDEILNRADIIFIAGWQFLTKIPNRNLVVLHDSLLPKFRGFSPTVNALLCGEPKIGVTAFKPVETVDAGPIYNQVAIDVSYPIKIKEAYSQLGIGYAQCAAVVIEKFKQGKLDATPQDDSQASYSIWREASDLFIDWNNENVFIRRFIDSIGWPYQGARTFYMNQEIIIDDAEEISPELPQELIHPGKIWAVKSNQPEIICKKGMIRILSARNLDNSIVCFNKTRERLGRLT